MDQLMCASLSPTHYYMVFSVYICVFFASSPFAAENMVSRNRFGRPVPRLQPFAHSPHSGSILVLIKGIPPAFRDGVLSFPTPTNGTTVEMCNTERIGDSMDMYVRYIDNN